MNIPKTMEKLKLNKEYKYVVRRIGVTTDRVTKHKNYVIEWGEVWNDKLHKEFGWVIKNTDRAEKITQPSIHANSKVWKVLHSVCGKHDLEEYEETTKTMTEEPIMLDPTKVETVTMINNARATEVSSDYIIETIKEQQTAIQKLEEVEADSKFVNKQIAEHKKSIVALVKILDAR